MAISLVNAWAGDHQERRAATLAREAGFEVVVTSSAVSGRVGLLQRTRAACVQAALTPVLERYLDSIVDGLEGADLLIMTSTGGLAERWAFGPIDGLLSGPAGGAIGAADVARRHGQRQAIAFDMGGTSTDVTRIADGASIAPAHRVGDVTLERPAVAVETVAAGGGSICGVRDGRPFVGPESAGAEPGPACYGAGGPLTLTDVNLLLNRITPEHFEVPIAEDDSRRAFQQVRRSLPPDLARLSDDELLHGFLDLANERIAEAIRGVSVRLGYDPADHALIAFGGAGGQHACAVADRLGMRSVLAPARASVLSAVGVSTAQRQREAERSLHRPLDMMIDTLPELISAAHQDLGVTGEADLRATLALRLEGQDATIDLDAEPTDSLADRFVAEYERLYGVRPARPIEAVRLRVVASEPARETATTPNATRKPDARGHHDAALSTRLHRDALDIDELIHGPTLIVDRQTTTHVPTGWRCRRLSDGCLELTRSASDERARPGS
ncbi:MAG: hydantoinase/oxoprolinase family protein, partial [Planctomycetota bacterium]